MEKARELVHQIGAMPSEGTVAFVAAALLSERIAAEGRAMERAAKLCETSRQLGTAMGKVAAAAIRIPPLDTRISEETKAALAAIDRDTVTAP